MSESDKNQALTVVIEKLTEIVDNINQRGQHDDSSSNSGGDSPPTEPVVLEIMPEEAETSTTGESNESTSHDPDDAGALTIKNEETASLEVRKMEEPAMVNVVKKGVTGEITVSKEERKPSANSTAPKELFKCVKCDYCSHNKHYLKQHVLLVHTTERPFKCPLCDYSGKRSHSLKEHLVVHSPYRPFTCPFCRASFRKKGHLTNHLKIHASDQGLPCPICKCTLSNPHEMSKHMRQEHLHEVYLCDECDCATTNEADMVAHKHSHGNPTVYCCTTCKYITVQDTSIRKHISTAHKGQGAFTVNSANTARASQPLILLKCSECGFVTRDKITLRNHMLEHHANQTAEASSRGKPSETAESTSTSSSSSSSPTSQAKSTTAEAQRSQHHSEDSSSSPEAKSLEISQSDYTRQSVSGVFCCMICGYTCDHQRSIKAHIWKHSGRKDINYPIFQTVKEPGPSQGSTTGERPKVLGDGGIDPSSEEVDSSCHDNQHQSISENLPAKSAIKTDKTEEGITREKMEDQGVIAEQSKVVTEALHEIKPLQLHTKQERTSEDEDADLRTGVKRKAATYSELDMSIPKLRIIEPMRDSNMNSDDQMNDSQMKLDTRKDFRVCEEAPVKLEQSVVTDQMTSDSPQRSPEVEDNVEEQVVIMESQVGEEYILEHVEIEVETSDDHKSASPYVEKENDENLPEHPTPVSLRALLQRQRSSGDLEKLTKVPVQRTRSGSLDAKTTEDTPQEQGISSSLLAVIEQFRKDAGPTLSADDEMFSEQYVKKFQDHYRCRICQYTSLYITSMKTHLRTHAQHAQRRPKHCNMCSFVAETDNQLDQHKLSHEQQEPITSREYAKTVPNIIRRQAQMKIQSTADVDLSEEEVITTSESPMKQYVCENCDCCFSSIEALLKHKMKKLCWNKHGASTGSDNGSSEEKDCFKCNFCDYIGMSVRSLKSHMKRHWNDLKANQLQESSHLQGSGDSSHAEKFYVCERCTSVFSNIMDLLSHKQNTCAGVVPKCMHCSFTSTDSEAFKKHMTQHVGKLYKCEQCDFVSKSYSKMDTHLKQHIEPSDLHCTLCDFIATSVRSLKSHMKRHVNDQRFVRQPLEQYKCKMCGYICHHLPALKSHMWRHASDSSYSYERTNAVINAALEVGVGNEANATNKASDTPPEYANEEVAMPNSADYSRKVVDGLVAFRCCHCFFETCSKTELNEHMKKHIDIIKKTMEVNNDLFLKKDKVNNT